VYTGAEVLVVATAIGVAAGAAVVATGCGVGAGVAAMGVTAGVAGTVVAGACWELPVQPAKSAAMMSSPVTIPMRRIWLDFGCDIATQS
jgi:hypothetical protein